MSALQFAPLRRKSTTEPTLHCSVLQTSDLVMHTLQRTTLEETKCHAVLLAIVLLRQANSCYCTRPH
eukprot:12482-Heterococcus_DN1.PRE.4